MAYEFDLGIPEGPFTDEEKSQIVEFVLGVDAETETVVVMSVFLLQTTEKDILELCFGIQTKHDGSGTSPPDYSKETTDQYVPKSGRLQVLTRITVAIDWLVEESKPRYIIMETYYSNLNQIALKKYDSVVSILALAGYALEDRWREENGIDYWLFKR